MKQKAEAVICGAGIAGITTAFHLAVVHGVKNIVLVDERAPMSLTSDKSTECYRNWWPGPGDDMVQMMNRSIDLLEEWARASGNVFHLNRRGYVYATCDAENISGLEAFAQEASDLGAGEVRRHISTGSAYMPLNPEEFEDQPEGADLLTNTDLIQRHFPYLSEDVAGLLHVRRAGWLSAQQLGTYLLGEARAHGVQMLAGTVDDVLVGAGRITGVLLADGTEIETNVFVNAAGPMLDKVANLYGEEFPLHNELHLKAAFNDQEAVLPREAPMVIYADEQQLPWDDEELEWLAEDEETRWLTQTLPSSAHTRPEGGLQAQTILLLWDFHNDPVDVHIPPELDPEFPELALRGLTRMIPGMQTYVGRLPKPYIDGGYYTKTQENRPLACGSEVEGAYVLGAQAGYGIMAAPAMGELAAAHITSGELPSYAPAFDLARYQDNDYQELLENWGASWQL